MTQGLYKSSETRWLWKPMLQVECTSINMISSTHEASHWLIVSMLVETDEFCTTPWVRFGLQTKPIKMILVFRAPKSSKTWPSGLDLICCTTVVSHSKQNIDNWNKEMSWFSSQLTRPEEGWGQQQLAGRTLYWLTVLYYLRNPNDIQIRWHRFLHETWLLTIMYI